MAEAEDEDIPPGYIWVSLGDYIDIAGESLVRDGLNKGHPCRYRDAWGNLRSGKGLPGGFWLDCAINGDEHSAKRRERIVPINPREVAFVEYLHTIPLTSFSKRETLSSLPPVREHIIPALEIFCIEVLVRRAEPKPREGPTEAVPVESVPEPAVPEPVETVPRPVASPRTEGKGGFQRERILAKADQLASESPELKLDSVAEPDFVRIITKAFESDPAAKRSELAVPERRAIRNARLAWLERRRRPDGARS